MSFLQAFKPKLSQWEEKRAQCLFEHKISGRDNPENTEDAKEDSEPIEEEAIIHADRHESVLHTSEKTQAEVSENNEKSAEEPQGEVEEIEVTEIEESTVEEEHLREEGLVEEDTNEKSSSEEDVSEEDASENAPDFSEITLNSRYLKGQDWEEKLKTNCPYSSPILQKEAPQDLPTHFNGQSEQAASETKLAAARASSDKAPEMPKGKEHPTENRDLVNIEKNYLKGTSLKKKEVDVGIVSRVADKKETQISDAVDKRKTAESLETEDKSKHAELEESKIDIAKPQQNPPQGFAINIGNSKPIDRIAIDSYKKKKADFLEQNRQQELASVNQKNRDRVSKPKSEKEFLATKPKGEEGREKTGKLISKPKRFSEREVPKAPITKEMVQSEIPKHKGSEKPKIRFRLKKDAMEENLFSKNIKSAKVRTERPLQPTPQPIKGNLGGSEERKPTNAKYFDAANFLDDRKEKLQNLKSDNAQLRNHVEDEEKLFKKSENLPKGMFEMFKSLDAKIQLDIQKSDNQEDKADKDTLD